jgi:DNA-binding winged helix-turn-helix (wHTH) protein/tetratricopeptide (TPR) repeat protein
MRAIVLAHEKNFSIGSVSVHPSTRSATRGSRKEILEPRVMQVLVALAHCPGEVVSRDDLVETCWAGRIVGDDAVNRVIARLRRTAEGIGAGVFAIDTITRVGYRLRSLDDAAVVAIDDEQPAKAVRQSISRRDLIVGGGVLTAAAGFAAGWLLLRNRSPEARLSTDSAAMMQQAKIAQWQNTREGQNQAIGLYRQIVIREPRYADGWGYLSLAYAWTAHYRQSAEAAMLRGRARAAAQQALALDAGNPLAEVGSATARPYLGNWLPIERTLRAAVAKEPNNGDLSFSLALFLGATGRALEALRHMNLVMSPGPTPAVYYYQAQLLWSAGRVEELDDLLAEARRLYPTHFALWFARFYCFIFSGRAQEAIAMAADTANRPTSIDKEEIEAVTRVAQAIQSPTASGAERIAADWLQRAHRGAGYAEIAAQFLTALGRVDQAFAVLRAYYFSDGFDCGEIRFNASAGTYTPRNDRLTAFLFNPALAPLRADARFGDLMERLGFAAYWRASGRPPDYLAGQVHGRG